jgi:hypothetical protein
MTTKSDTFTIHNPGPSALNVLTDDGGGGMGGLSAKFRTLAPGDSMTVTPEIVAANADRTGWSWLTDDEDAQHERYGKLKFGLGEPPAHVRQKVAAARRDKLLAERADLMSRVPRSVDRSRYLSGRVDKIDAEIDRLDKEIAA